MKLRYSQLVSLTSMCALLLIGINEASATSSRAQAIESYCSNNNYPLLPEFSSNLCNACHGSTQAQQAYSSGDLAYFCPEPIASGPTCTDLDNDGFYVEGLECGTPADFNDNNQNAYPGAPEICTDGIDNDGNGLTDAADMNAVGCPVNCTDMDNDGYSSEGGACGPMDCNDSDPAINPGAVESCLDGIDNNCNGLTDTADMNAVNCPISCTDLDNDGYSIEGGSCGAIDCDDSDATVNPGALEICDDGIDNNCNSLLDGSDSVCQSNGNTDGDNEEDSRPWWRSRYWDRDDSESQNNGGSGRYSSTDDRDRYESDYGRDRTRRSRDRD